MSVLLLDVLEQDAMSWLHARHTVEFQPALADDMAALHKALYKTEALIVPWRVKITRDLLNFAPRLRIIGRIHDGTENIDMDACRRRLVRVVQANEAQARAQTEYLLLALLLLFRRGIGLTSPMSARGCELANSTVGFMGLTPVAHLLSNILVPMGVKLLGYDPSVHHSAKIWERLGVMPLTLTEMLHKADAITVQMHYATRYRGLINENLLRHCKPGQLWASISRASLFDLRNLSQALQDGRIRACMLDSHDPLLTHGSSPLKSVPNLWLTPEISGSTLEARQRGSWYLVDRVHEVLTSSHPQAEGFATLVQQIQILPTSDNDAGDCEMPAELGIPLDFSSVTPPRTPS